MLNLHFEAQKLSGVGGWIQWMGKLPFHNVFKEIMQSRLILQSLVILTIQ
jgi:hypothetical protein